MAQNINSIENVLVIKINSLYRVSHFKWSNPIFQKLNPVDKNVSDKSCWLEGGQDGDIDLTLDSLLKVTW